MFSVPPWLCGRFGSVSVPDSAQWLCGVLGGRVVGYGLRPTWKGYLKISLVNIPIKVFPATDAGATLSFNQLHAECQTRIQQKRWCPKCEREVPNTEIVKGFEFEKGRYVVVGEEDIEKVRVDSTRVINLEKFTDDTAIDPIYLERPYYLAPDGDVAKEAFAVIREAA